MSGLTTENEPTRREIGKRVHEARADSGLSYEALAAAAEISLSKLYRVIKGESDAGAVEIWRIARATGKRFSWFAGEDASEEDDLLAHVRRLNGAVDGLTALATDLGAELHHALLRLVPVNVPSGPAVPLPDDTPGTADAAKVRRKGAKPGTRRGS